MSAGLTLPPPPKGEGRSSRWIGWPRRPGPPRTRPRTRWDGRAWCGRTVQRGLQGPAHRELVDQPGGLGPTMCTPRISPVALSATTLTESPGLALRDRPAAGRERELAHRELARPRGRRLGEPDGRNLRMAIGAGRHVAVVDRPRGLARDRLRGHDPLRHRLVGEELVARHVADRVDPSPSLHGRRHRHEAALGGDPSARAQPARARARPTAISTWSALSVSVLPSASTSTENPGRPRHALDRHPGADRDVAPENRRAIWVDASSSSMGRTRGRASRTVTAAPYAA